MDPETEKIIEEQLKSLPNEVKDFIADPELLGKILEIGQDNGLDKEQLKMLETETFLALIDLVPINEFEDGLREKLPPDLAEVVILEINEKIFKPVWSLLAGDTPREEDNIGGSLDDRFKQLPKNIQDAIEESNYQNALYEISKDFKFTIEQMGVLEQAVVEIMLGQISEGEFERRIKNTLGLRSEEVVVLINSINEKILVGIKGKVMAPVVPPAQINKGEMEVLHNAGIKIIEPDLSLPEISAPKNNHGVAMPEEKKINPLFSQKFSGSVQTSTVKTEHVDMEVRKDAPESRKDYPKGGDPYRMMPD